MKTLFIFLASLFYITANAQTISFKIEGNVADTTGVKFAYLSTLSQQINVSSDKLFLKVPIVNGKFLFDSHFDLEGNSMQQACIFLDKRDNITQAEVAIKFKNFIWITGKNPELLRIILEDLSVRIENKQETYNASITQGGLYTNDYREWIVALKKDRKSVVAFIQTHRNSPICLLAISDMLSPPDGKLLPINETSHALFNILSPQLKASKDGIEIARGL